MHARRGLMPWRAKYIVAAYTAPFLYALWIDLNFHRPLVEHALRRLLPSAAPAAGRISKFTHECE